MTDTITEPTQPKRLEKKANISAHIGCLHIADVAAHSCNLWSAWEGGHAGQVAASAVESRTALRQTQNKPRLTRSHPLQSFVNVVACRPQNPFDRMILAVMRGGQLSDAYLFLPIGTRSWSLPDG